MLEMQLQGAMACRSRTSRRQHPSRRNCRCGGGRGIHNRTRGMRWQFHGMASYGNTKPTNLLTSLATNRELRQGKKDVTPESTSRLLVTALRTRYITSPKPTKDPTSTH